jgi:phosphatidylglycerol:prolipoprotein diacylglycerol transferase
MLPQLFQIGSFSLSGYAFCYGLGLVLTCLTIYALASKEKCDRLETVNYILLTVIASLLGAKLYGVAVVFLKSPAAALRNPEPLRQAFLTGGVFYGGLAAGTVFAVFYLRRFFRNIIWRMLDITVIGVALGHAVGRIGCFLAGCCYGRPTRLPWGVRFQYLGRFPHPFAGVAIHPTQLYEAALNLVNFALLLVLRKKRTFEGRLVGTFIVVYGSIRFLVEYFRNDPSRGYILRGHAPLLSLSVPQVISLGLIVIGLGILKTRKRASRMT